VDEYAGQRGGAGVGGFDEHAQTAAVEGLELARPDSRKQDLLGQPLVQAGRFACSPRRGPSGDPRQHRCPEQGQEDQRGQQAAGRQAGGPHHAQLAAGRGLGQRHQQTQHQRQRTDQLQCLGNAQGEEGKDRARGRLPVGDLTEQLGQEQRQGHAEQHGQGGQRRTGAHPQQVARQCR